MNYNNIISTLVLFLYAACSKVEINYIKLPHNIFSLTLDNYFLQFA